MCCIYEEDEAAIGNFRNECSLNCIEIYGSDYISRTFVEHNEWTALKVKVRVRLPGSSYQSSSIATRVVVPVRVVLARVLVVTQNIQTKSDSSLLKYT